MSLDVYLTVDGDTNDRQSSSIFVRIDGATREITREEWDQMYPGRAPVVAARERDVREYAAHICAWLARQEALRRREQVPTIAVADAFERLVAHDFFWRGVLDFRAGRPPQEDNTDGWYYERGRLFAAYLKRYRGKILMRPRNKRQQQRAILHLQTAFQSGAIP